jgi:L-threonylcarbamoyladenylate synthase
MQPAVFFDRDGTLIEDRGHIDQESDVVFYPETVPSLKRLQERFRLFIVTNQPGIAEGTITREGVERVNRHVTEHLAAHGIEITDVYFCPHSRSDGCSCIKPNPRFLRQAERDHGIDLERSYVVGDHPSDVELADSAGAHGVYVLTGHGEKHRPELPEGVVVEPGIQQATHWILLHDACTGDIATDGVPVSRAAGIIRSGGVVVFPTETVYGIGANALDPEAVSRIFEIKERPLIDPLIVHVAEMAQVGTLAREIPPKARALGRRFWPGPLTLVLPKQEVVPHLVTAGLPSVAIRMPEHPIARMLIRESGCPIAAPSANTFGRTSPTTLDHLEPELARAVDAVINGGPCRVGVESTIVSFCEDRPTVLRPGGVPVEEIERTIGEVEIRLKAEKTPRAPGMLDSHYAPETPLVLKRADAADATDGRVGLLAFRRPEEGQKFAAVEVLSPSGDLREAASNLYSALHRLDAEELDCIVAEPLPGTGLGRAIMDRLQRASCRPPSHATLSANVAS